MSPERRGGFTLIEVLIVVVIMAVLAATILPQFTSTAGDAKQSTLSHNMHTMRSLIELYKTTHLSGYPAITDNDLPQLTNATNGVGETGTPGEAYPHGPYIVHALPDNPFDGSNKVTAVATAGEKPTAVVGNLGGWLYDATTGEIWPNNAEYYQ